MAVAWATGVSVGTGSTAGISAGALTGTVKLQLNALPGVMRAGSVEMAVEPALVALAAQPDREFIGQIERSRGGWRLIAFKPVARPAPKGSGR